MPVPDRVMVKRLKEYDKKLFVEFDFDKERFVVWRKPQHECGPPLQIMVVQNDDGSFRPLDMRTVDALVKGDSWRNEDIIKDIDANNKKIEDDIEASVRDTFRQAAIEDLYRRFFGGSQVQGWGGKGSG